MKHYKYTFIAFFALVVFGTPWFVTRYPTATRFVDNIFSYVGQNYVNYSAIFFQKGITSEELKNKYNSIDKEEKKINILIVPGHEPGFGGTEFGNIKERDLVVDISKELKLFFNMNPHYNVMLSRDENNWDPKLQKYFDEQWNSIISFTKENKEEMVRLVNNGKIKKSLNNVYHNAAPQKTALRLYGINKWSNENNIDLILHIHLNDYSRKNTDIPGDFTGFAIYVPERQYSNSLTTKTIALNLFRRLKKYNAVSNFPEEESGVVEDQDLISIGNSNTLDAPSMLIEYGYIYEPQFNDAKAREIIIKDLALQTYLGIQDFFDPNNQTSVVYDTLMLPHTWEENIDKNSKNKGEILALQSVLIEEGYYPPKNKTKNECPRTGKFGPCTTAALTNFQNRYGIKDETNIVGKQTQRVLNSIYSTKTK